jgi:Arc/MetJ family transcription regulator
VIFKAVRDGKPYPDHGLSLREWARIPPRQVRLDQLVTTKRELALDRLLAEDSTFYGDLFPHVVEFAGALYLEDGLHRALRAALQQRTTMHVRVLLYEPPYNTADTADTAQAEPAEPSEAPQYSA